MEEGRVAAGRLVLRGPEQDRIALAVSAAEARTSGEIVVRVVPAAKGNPRDHAIREFHGLGLEKTKDRTGVLIFVAARQHAIEILGDAGINAKVPPGFWEGTVARLSAAFKAGRYADGLCEAVAEVARELATHFPRAPDDRNELPDRPVVG